MMTEKVDVVSKFYYLEHGKPAPKNSEYKGIITTASIIGFKDYTERKASKKLSKVAQAAQQEQTSFFDYTTKRFGAQKTYSSIGWLDTTDQTNDFKELIANSFQQDGDVIWASILSLNDFLESKKMNLFNEEDYATIFAKILPSWFKNTGFDPENMGWWMDYHVNTDNPHIHLNFFEFDKTVMSERKKLPMKQINAFKGMFWNEVFAKQRYLEATGKSVEVSFKNKDLLKHETYRSFTRQFRKNIKSCSDKQFIDGLRNLYRKLPATGRLQYNSSHMIPYRQELDELVNNLLHTPDVIDKYAAFINCLREFDNIKSENLKTEYHSIEKQEDDKLRVQLANAILQEYKQMDRSFWLRFLQKETNTTLSDTPSSIPRNTVHFDSIDSGVTRTDQRPVSSSMQAGSGQEKILIPIAKSLVKQQKNGMLFIRMPSTHFYIYIQANQCTIISEEKEFRVGHIDPAASFEVFTEKGSMIGTISADQLNTYFDDGEDYMDSLLNRMEKQKQWLLHKKMWSTQQDWNATGKRVQHASFSWMSKVENDVEQARDEYLYGKAMI